MAQIMQNASQILYLLFKIVLSTIVLATAIVQLLKATVELAKQRRVAQSESQKESGDTENNKTRHKGFLAQLAQDLVSALSRIVSLFSKRDYVRVPQDKVEE